MAHLNARSRTSFTLEEWAKRSGPGGGLGIAFLVIAATWAAFMLALVVRGGYDLISLRNPAASVLLPLWLFMALAIGALDYAMLSALISQLRLHDRLVLLRDSRDTGA